MSQGDSGVSEGGFRVSGGAVGCNNAQQCDIATASAKILRYDTEHSVLCHLLNHAPFCQLLTNQSMIYTCCSFVSRPRSSNQN